MSQDNNQNIDELVLQYIKTNSGVKARQIAQALNRDKKEINSRLYGELKNKCYIDNQYKWYLGEKKSSQALTSENQGGKSNLAKLCRYYLACIAEDAGMDISVFAQSKFGLDYRELEKLPLEDPSSIFESENTKDFFVSSAGNASTAHYFGYPVVANHIRSRKSSWEGYMLSPVFLFPILRDSENANSLSIDWNFPVLNKAVLEKFTNAKGEELINEMVLLEEQLGFIADEEQPELDDLVKRLEELRPEWPWMESIDPYELTKGPTLAEVDKEGVYNRALVLRIKEKPSNYTRGLEVELSSLARLSDEDVKDTALGKWINRDNAEPDVQNLKSLLGVFPMNLEQREAINRSLENDLTVITGPPGTGKSQVVSNLLINGRWQGKKTLFASKNNKAVDVVEIRVNNLSDKPVLLRLGSKSEHQNQLIHYISNLLSAAATKEEKQEYKESLAKYEEIQSRYLELDSDENDLISLRNETDRYERELGLSRNEISDDLFKSVKDINIREFQSRLGTLTEVLDKIEKSQNGFLGKLIHSIFKHSHYREVEKQVGLLQKDIDYLDIEMPSESISDQNIVAWMAALKSIHKKVSIVRSVHEYYKSLKELSEHISLEDIAKERMELLEQMSAEAQELWDLWLRVQASELTTEDRSVLSQYKTTLQMVNGENVTKRAWASYYQQSEKVSHILSCMAITSLSAKGRIPFQPGIFDIVVFDEASQCDIASALPLLYRAKRAVVIGDPNQLSHISTIHKKEDQRLLDKYGLLGEFNDWAYSYNSLYDLASGLTLGRGVIDLRDHYRSHADIINFSNETFYEGRLRIATKYDQLKRINKSDPGIRWIDVKGKAEKPPSGSGALNKAEAEAVAKELRRLVEIGYSGTVGVVSPFRAQANLINQIVSSDKDLLTDLGKLDFLCDTVHKFQGDERDIMLFSPVVSPGIPSGSLLFLKKTGNLFNVAITRARAILIVVGNNAHTLSSGVQYMEMFAKYVNNLDASVVTEEDLEAKDLGPEYPVVSHPERVSDWEHLLYKELYNAGVLSIPQYPVERYVLDFAIITDNGKKLNIEVDGEHYHKDWTGELCHRDQIRNQRLYELGWDVKRFWVYQVRDDMQQCIADIKEWVKRN